MRISRFASIIAIALFSTGAMAQSNSTDQSGNDVQTKSQIGEMNSEDNQTQNNPDMQADTVEGQNQGASAQYEMSSEDGQTSDDVDAGDSGSPSAREQLMKGTKQEEEATPSAESTGEQH